MTRLLRWTMPAGLGALVVAATLVVPSITAAAGVDLPERTPAQLLTDLQGANVTAVQGTVRVVADLGLPSLPSAATAGRGPHGSSATDLTSILSGTTTMRVWASHDGARAAVLGTLGETDVITDGTGVWIWSSADRTATHLTPPASTASALAGATGHEGLAGLQGLAGLAGGSAGSDPRAALAALTPEQLSQAVLAALEPTTNVTTGPTTRVAGRPAYQLVLTPTDPGSLVGSVTIAIDAAQRVPTQVTITSTATGKPALTVGFTEVSFAAPDPQVFAFTPPVGAKVEQHALGDQASGSTTHGTLPHANVTPTVVGKGWASVLVLAGVGDLTALTGTGGSAGASGPTATGNLSSWLDALPHVSGAWGSGRLLSTHLLTVLLTDDGRVLVGAVDPATIEAAASTTR